LTMASMDEEWIAAVRQFNRFYTQKIGVLRERLADSPFSLTEARVLYELAHRANSTPTGLSQFLALDPGYVSRILLSFERKKLLGKKPSPADRRQTLLTLTPAGRKAFVALDRRTVQDLRQVLDALPDSECRRLAAAMRTIETVLGDPPASNTVMPYLLRPPRPGDMGWVVSVHGRLYASEYNWDETFEGLVAGIVAKFVETFDPKRERGWIAERDGENVGCVFVVKDSSTVARLRMLIVDPRARGLGMGRRLVEECVRFARQVGYRKLTLWTVSQLVAARRLYEAAGFQLVKKEPEHSFGHDVVNETWDLDL